MLLASYSGFSSPPLCWDVAFVLLSAIFSISQGSSAVYIIVKGYLGSLFIDRPLVVNKANCYLIRSCAASSKSAWQTHRSGT